jgi:mRNA interferase MazF
MTGSSTSAARTSRLNPRPWEIWLAYVRFADHPDVGKVRPIVIIDERVSAIVAAKVTTAVPQERFLYCELADWQVEGLLRPLRAQVVPLFEVSRADVLRDTPLGTLTERDRVALQAALDAADGHGL